MGSGTGSSSQQAPQEGARGPARDEVMEDAALPPVQPDQSETLPSLQGQAIVTPPSRPAEPAEQSRSDQERIQADIAQLSA